MADDTVSQVEKLQRKLSDATSEATMGSEEVIGKLLKKLSLLPMTLEILQVTQVGRQVNKLRKWKGGKVSSRAKALVKHWKQLLPASESEEPNTSMESLSGTELAYGGERLEVAGTPETASYHHLGSRGLEHHPQPMSVVPVIQVESGGDSEASVLEIAGPGSAGHVGHSSRHHKDKAKKKKKKRKRTELEDGEGGESFRSFEMCLDPGVRGGGKRRGQERTGAGRESGEEVLVVGVTAGRKKMRSQSPAFLPVGGMRERSPGMPLVGSRDRPSAPPDPPATTAVKRKEVEPQVTVAQSKRSRTQVYSGKKAHSGPQVVSSLFDMCMKILIDNIDVIEEVGAGVPYHVLEPLLQRCSATQLMKLEEFNPHLVEDTENLWRKHVAKDFKVVKLPAEYTWRELYREQVAEREEKLKNLTARIKANNHAREEPVRKVKLAVPVVKPGRRSGGIKRGGFSRPMERPHSGSQLMKRTMKMAQERNHMVAFKRGKR